MPTDCISTPTRGSREIASHIDLHTPDDLGTVSSDDIGWYWPIKRTILKAKVGKMIALWSDCAAVRASVRTARGARWASRDEVMRLTACGHNVRATLAARGYE